MTNLLGIADELYGLPLGDFTPAGTLRSSSSRAPTMPRTPRPSRPCASRRRPPGWSTCWCAARQSRSTRSLSVGAALRAAQERMSGDDLRALTKQRRQVTAAMTQTARSLAHEEGVKVTQAVADQVEATLTAAMLDETCAQAVRSGLLVSPLSTTGVDEVDAARGRGARGARLHGHGARRQPRRRRRSCTSYPIRRRSRRRVRPPRRRWPLPRTRWPRRRRPTTTRTAWSRTSRRERCSCRPSSTSSSAASPSWRRPTTRWTRQLGDAEDARTEADGALRAVTRDRDAAARRWSGSSSAGPALGALDRVDPPSMGGVGRLPVVLWLERADPASTSRAGRRSSPRRRCRARRGTPHRARSSRPGAVARPRHRSGRPGSGRAGRWRRRLRRPAGDSDPPRSRRAASPGRRELRRRSPRGWRARCDRGWCRGSAR